MLSFNPKMRLVSSTAADCGPVVESLTRIGCQVQIQACDDWMNCPGPADPTEILVVLFGASETLRQDVLKRLQNNAHLPSLLIFSGRRAIQDTEFARCCSEFLTWPCSDDELVARVERVWFSCVRARRPSQSRSLPPEVVDAFAKFNLIGESPAFLRTLQRIKNVSRCEAPVIIEGETGTGKELAARAVHYLGPRTGGAFIPVNCGAIQDSLMESELFGHQRGAFTGATQSHTGLIRQADGGTLFLDEIEELSPKGQVSLLRFLQDQCYRAVGATELKIANVRVIAASNQRLADLVSQGEFRADLYYRLAVMSIDMPPLRERKEDIRLLAIHFLQRFVARYEQPRRAFRPDSLTWLQLQPWPGNVRELENFVHRSYFLSDTPFVTLSCCGATPADDGDPPEDGRFLTFSEEKAKVVNDFERRYLGRLMEASVGNVTIAARKAGKERRAFGKLLKKHNLDRSSFIRRSG